MFYSIKFIDILEKMTKVHREKKTPHWGKAAMPNYH